MYFSVSDQGPSNLSRSSLQRPTTISLGSKVSAPSNHSLVDETGTPAATPLFAKKKLFDVESQVVEGDSQTSKCSLYNHRLYFHIAKSKPRVDFMNRLKLSQV